MTISSRLCSLDTLTPVPQMTASHRPVSPLAQGSIDRTFQVLDNRTYGRDGRRVSIGIIVPVKPIQRLQNQQLDLDLNPQGSQFAMIIKSQSLY
jgi:hypothetical protein